MIAFLIAILALVFAAASHAAPQSPRSMLVILLPGTTLSDWVNDPTMHKLMDQGAVGLMNTRTARMTSDKRREPPAAAVLTLAAGARAAVPAEQEALAITPVSPGSSVYSRWALVEGANRSLGYQANLANLADGLKAAKVELYSLDMGDPWSEDGDRHLTVDAGSFDNYNEADLFVSENGTTDSLDMTGLIVALRSGSRIPPALLSRIPIPATEGALSDLRWHDDAPVCCVIDLSRDVARQPIPAADAWDRPYLTKIDGDLSAFVDLAHQSHTRLLILSPFVNDRAYADDDRLAPVLMLGDGVPHGLLYSPSTRHAGLITNTDIAPTIAAYFGAKLPTPAFGRAVTFAPSKDPVGDVRELRSNALRQRHGQRVLPYCAIILGLCLVALSFTRISPAVLRVAYTLPPAIILALLIAPSLPYFVTQCGFFVVLLMVLPIMNRSNIGSFGASVAMVFVVLSNTIFNDGVIFSALLGYSPIEGARYYGIGNEVMGVVTGATLVLLSAWWPVAAKKTRRFGQAFLVASMVAIVAIVGAPSMGAKAGGVIVLVGAFAVFLMSSAGKQLTGRRLIAAAGLGIATLMAFAIADSLHASGSRSHMGAAIALIHHGGVGQAFDIIGRKLAVEFKLATHSTWAVPVWAGLVCLMQQRKRALAGNDRAAIALLDSTLVAAILMLLFNDAGAVACALLLSIVCSYAAAYGANDSAIEQAAPGSVAAAG